jgi:tetratricopeptide (TPR) repeat protein
MEIDKEAEFWEAVCTQEGDAKAKALIELSYIASHRGEYGEALAFCETAREIYEALDSSSNLTVLAHVYFGISHCLRNLKRPLEAALTSQKSADIYREVGSEEEVHILNETGDAWYEAKEYELSYAAYKRAIESVNPDTCRNILARNYADAGTALEKLKRWSEAKSHFESARNIYKSNKDLRMIAHCDEEISLCHFWLGNGPDSLYFAQMAIDYAITAEDQTHIMWAKARIGLAHKLLGNYEEALENLTSAKSMMVKEECPPWKAVIRAEKQISGIHELMGNTNEAKKILKRLENLESILDDSQN